MVDTSILDNKSLDDLKPITEEHICHMIEPTDEEVMLIVEDLKVGKSFKEIKKARRRFIVKEDIQTSAQGFTLGQIKEIELAWKTRIIELTEGEDEQGEDEQGEDEQ